MKDDILEIVKNKIGWLFLLVGTFISVVMLTFAFHVFKDTRVEQEKMKIELLLDIQRDLKDIKRYYE